MTTSPDSASPATVKEMLVRLEGKIDVQNVTVANIEKAVNSGLNRVEDRLQDHEQRIRANEASRLKNGGWGLLGGGTVVGLIELFRAVIDKGSS